MSRHLADHRTPSAGEKIKRFWELERSSGEEGSHPASRQLSQRAVDRPKAGSRVREFLRIERGYRA